MSKFRSRYLILPWTAFVWILLAQAAAVFADESPRTLADSREQEGPGTSQPTAAAAVGTASPSGSAEEESQPAQRREMTVQEIVVEGNKIINTHTILNKIRTRKGEALKRDLISDDIKRLYATGFFQDIKMDFTELPSGYRVVVTVMEKPIVKQVIIEGSSKFSAADLRKELKIVDGQVLNDYELQEGLNAIRGKYQEKGYQFVDVKSDLDINEETKEAVLYIIVDEGTVYKIREFNLTGIKSFKERKIRKLFKTKKVGFLRRGRYQEEKFRDDLDRARAFYQDQGFLDVKIDPKFSYDHEAKSIKIDVAIEEGSQYLVGKIDIEGNIIFPESEIWEELEMLPGVMYSPRRLAEDMEAIRRFYYERGYMNADVQPEIVDNPSTGKMDVVYRITEGDLFFVEQIKIRGNTKTKDLVIRREILIFPGERFDGKKLERSITKLKDLDYFEDVSFTTEDGSAPNRRDVIFHVKEKRTGELSFGAGISSVETFLGFAEISQRNFDLLNFPTFTGAGQLFSVRGRLGSVRQDIDLVFVEPYLFNKPYSLSLGLFSRTNQRLNTDFEEQRMGFSIDVGKRFTETIRSAIGYTLENVKLQDLEVDASPDVLASGTDNLLSRLRWSISRDSRDSVRKPTYGSVASFGTELVGSFLGGDQDLFKFNAGFTKYFMFGRHHFEWSNRFGVVTPFGDSDQVPVFERYFAGGLGSVRGFDARRVGPIEAGDAVGGSTIALTSLEYTFPIIENFHGALFTDLGHVNEATFDFDFDDIAVSIGPGVKINTPIGPVALYYGFPIANRDDDKSKNGKFEFSLSRGF
ncbi:MAG: outer membrane protein assembly factor BamA [Candidatus Omnitrophica bacterium]|nr:outer membrane protein assembly factor BamA [Candidatus Omnitrophota bacterium]